MFLPTCLKWCFCWLCWILCLYALQSDETDIQNKIARAHSFWICLELTSLVQKTKTQFKECVSPNDCNAVFADCTESVVYMFVCPKQWNRNIEWNSLCACFYIVRTRKPGTISKTLFLSFFAKMIAMVLLLTVRNLFICVFLAKAMEQKWIVLSSQTRHN